MKFFATISISSWLLSLFPLVTKAYYRGGPIYGNNFGIPGKNATYDYVVVGGGTGGLAIAARLAQNTSNTVAVIEVGGFYEIDNGNLSVVPNLGLVYDANLLLLTDAYPTVDWGLVTTNQTGLMGQSYHYWRGRTLGGSSALNNEVYQRGTRQSYQMWAQLVNDTTYDFDQFLPYFAKGVHYTPSQAKRPSNASVPTPDIGTYSTTGGPLEVGYINFPLPWGSWTKLAFQELGFKVLTDFNSGQLLGTQYTPQTIAPDMTRSSSQASYLDWAIASGRQNLLTYTRTMAKRILFDGNKFATGVQVTTLGLPYTISARKEVIVSAGAINSPQMLMVSGIGPSATLNSLNIPIVADLPGVGQNLWDHTLFTLTHQVNVQGEGRDNNPVNFLDATAEYRANRTGQLTNTGFDYIAWEKLPTPLRANLNQTARHDLAQFPADWPEIEFIVADGTILTNDNSYGSIIAALVAPLSRGNVTVTSGDTHDLPVFNPNWLSHPTDQQLAVQAFHRCRAVFNATSLKPVLVGPEVVPGPDVQSDADILAFIRRTATTVYHASCTCKMGTRDDPMAVLDSRARVFGVHNLRVVDASAFPVLPPGHPSSTVYALAEKIADDIMKGR